MAQLRDARTSAPIAEGSPLEVALAARELGKSAVVGVGDEVADDVEVIFDDVGVGFDPDAVIAAHDETVASLADVAASDEIDDAAKERLAARLADAEEEANVAELVESAGAAMAEARERAAV